MNDDIANNLIIGIYNRYYMENILNSEQVDNLPITQNLKDILSPFSISIEKVSNQGAFGWILLTNDQFGKKYAIKIIKYPQSDEIYEKCLEEYKVLAKIHHSNIIDIKIPLFFEYKNEKYFGYIMEWLEGGTLRNKMRILQDNPIEKKALYFYQLFDALDHINQKLEQHYDLHDENIMISPEKLTVIDLGQKSSDIFIDNSISDFNKSQVNAWIKNIFKDDLNIIKFKDFKGKKYSEYRDFFKNFIPITKVDEKGEDITELIQSFETFSENIVNNLIKLRRIAKQSQRQDIVEWISGELNGFDNANDPKIPLYRKKLPVSAIQYEKIYYGNISRKGRPHIMTQFDLSNSHSITTLIDHQDDEYIQILFPSLKDEKGFDTYIRWEQPIIKKIINNVRLHAIDYLHELRTK